MFENFCIFQQSIIIPASRMCMGSDHILKYCIINGQHTVLSEGRKVLSRSLRLTNTLPEVSKNTKPRDCMSVKAPADDRQGYGFLDSSVDEVYSFSTFFEHTLAYYRIYVSSLIFTFWSQ